MTTKQPATPAPTKHAATENQAISHAIRDYVSAHQQLQGQQQTAENPGRACPGIPCGAT